MGFTKGVKVLAQHKMECIREPFLIALEYVLVFDPAKDQCT
jgi:hypothetical protein